MMHRMGTLAAIALSALTWSAACTKQGSEAAATVRATIAAVIHGQHDSLPVTDPTTGSPGSQVPDRQLPGVHARNT